MTFVPCRKLRGPLQYRIQTSPQGQPLGSQTEIFQVLVPLFGHLEVLQVCLAQFRDQVDYQQFGCTYGAMFQAYGLHSFFDIFSLVGTSK